MWANLHVWTRWWSGWKPLKVILQSQKLYHILIICSPADALTAFLVCVSRHPGAALHQMEGTWPAAFVSLLPVCRAIVLCRNPGVTKSKVLGLHLGGVALYLLPVADSARGIWQLMCTSRGFRFLLSLRFLGR